MAFRKKYRGQLPNIMINRYTPYWHAVHPLTFDPIELIYRAAFEEDEWEALQLLRQRRGEVINSSRTFDFHPSMISDIEGGVPKDARVAFYLPDDMPKVSIKDTALPQTNLREIFKWIIVAYRHKAEREALRSMVYKLMHGSYINTPGQLFHVWPGLVAHLDSRYRGVMRKRRCNSQLPVVWTADRIAEFQSTDEFERLDHILAVLALTNYEKTDEYPQIL